MRIDDQIEGVVRGVFEAVVKRNPDKLDQATAAFPSNDARAKGLELALAVCMFILAEEYQGSPSAEEARLLSVEVAELCQWAGISGEDTNTFFSALLARSPLDSVFDPDTAFMLTFIITGCLIASSEKIDKDEWWFNYLDRIEAAIEAAPDA